MELDLNDLEQVSGGKATVAAMRDWLYAHPAYLDEARKRLSEGGRSAVTYYMIELIEAHNLPQEWKTMAHFIVSEL